MAGEMTREQWRAFVSAGTRTAKLATVRKDGRPHVVPIWFVLDGDDFVFTTAAESVKGRILVREGLAALCVDDQEPPFSYVSAEGAVEISDDLGDMLRWATLIGGRYMGPDRAEEFGRRNAVEGELVVRLAPSKVIARAGVAD